MANASTTAELKQIAHDVLTPIASDILMKRVYELLDKGARDDASLKQTCISIEKMVNIFIGTDTAQMIGKQFRETLYRAGTI